MSSSDIQRLFYKPDSMGRVNLPAGEFEGCFTIKKSCTVNGNGTVLWRGSGPAVIIEAENVRLNNLKIELTNDNIPDEQYISVYCKNSSVKFSDVEVNGAVVGIPDEEQYWGIPKMLSLGTLAAERQESFSIEIYAPCEAELLCGIHDITLSRDSLSQGFNTVTLTVGKIRSGSIIYGNIYIKSAANITRKIFVNGFIGGAEEPSPVNYLLYSVDREAPRRYMSMIAGLNISRISAMPAAEAEQVSIRLEDINESDDDTEEFGTEDVEIFSARRIPLAPKQYRIELKYASARTKLDIDAYMFMLNDAGKVNGNSGMIFFGNDHSECGSIRYLNAPDKRAVFVDLRQIPKEINHMVMLFSIYGNDPTKLFDKLIGGEITILNESGVNMHLKLDSNLNCRTILALGFERTDGIW
ncbi:MAG: TerD family protein, partial [Oscillospiraceae bacterium]|nr:TerD family protein [Oscillospiraceae bacterium]